MPFKDDVASCFPVAAPARAVSLRRAGLLAAFCLLAPGAAFAALPSVTEPGREAPQPVLPQPTPPGQPITVPKASAAQAPAGAEQLTFTLNEMAIEGATAYGPELLRPLYADLIGKRITVADAFKVAGEIELRYRSAGYVTSRVIVPEQTIDQGRFRIVVVEGYVSDIAYDADIGPAKAALAKLLEPLRGVKPINVAEIERRLLLANDLGGLAVRASLEPSPDQVGGSRVVVRAERDAIDGSVSIDNRNTRYLGSHQLSGSLVFNSFGERADRVSLTAKASTPAYRSSAVSAAYDALLSSDGMTGGISATRARSRPGRELAALDVRSKVRNQTATLTYPLIRSRLQNLRLVGEFEHRDVDTDIGGDPFTRDKLRILRVGLSYDRSDDWNGITALRATLHKGLDVMGATDRGADLASRENGRSDFAKLTLDLTRVQQLGERTSLLATFTSQFSADSLLASEEISLGGPTYGRGYDDGEIASDNGIAGSLELRYSPEASFLPGGLQLYTFVDGGRIRAHSGSAPVVRRSISSYGGGLRANLSSVVFATLDLAKPISSPVQSSGDKKARLFFKLTAQY
ncbi:ShlB/FhaC/HecB family hemolysin secretion/activation protein [Chitinimonas koreensis]|uniref:ShlB/FhaC/HecB family hemolysin secretion/activation protein n=1 Tax=Chitinimonas koreensis TaxID=356302 RepID=UPI0004289058|nr:ShlB/FhaC/HecB family hemolysin secretion/activation protein [Chitinimonas koreensis]QNM96903.1 ShlB/FhaC/HecB family hemolysin secretion/activation protein [Chitinimonas koreensis]